MDQRDLLRYAIDTLERLDLKYAVVGSIASIAYGESRFTHDIDIVVEIPIQKVAAFCASFPDDEYYLSETAVRDGIRLGVPFNVIHPTSGQKIDFIIPRPDELGHLQLQRRRREQLLHDRKGYTASPEDVIIGKLVYYAEGGSEKHLRDITGILRLCPYPVDRDDIAKWAEKLGVSEVWQAILSRLSGIENKNPS